jgi:NAD dependent epimerase/dehydratase family enzyme
MVLTPDGGALKKMNLPIKLGIGSPIGSGKQWMPWIHIDDLNAAFLHVLRNKIPGKINVCSEVLDNKTFMRAFAKTLNKPFFFPNVPAFVMKLIFGEMSSVLLNGVQVSNEKLLDSGYTLKYPCLKEAFFDLYG